jgi:hypothetical protein
VWLLIHVPPVTVDISLMESNAATVLQIALFVLTVGDVRNAAQDIIYQMDNVWHVSVDLALVSCFQLISHCTIQSKLQ